MSLGRMRRRRHQPLGHRAADPQAWASRHSQERSCHPFVLSRGVPVSANRRRFRSTKQRPSFGRSVGAIAAATKEATANGSPPSSPAFTNSSLPTATPRRAASLGGHRRPHLQHQQEPVSLGGAGFFRWSRSPALTVADTTADTTKKGSPLTGGSYRSGMRFVTAATRQEWREAWAAAAASRVGCGYWPQRSRGRLTLVPPDSPANR